MGWNYVFATIKEKNKRKEKEEDWGKEGGMPILMKSAFFILNKN